MSDTASVGGKLGIAGVLEYLDKDGNVLKTVEIKGSIPLTDEQVVEVAKDMEIQDGTDYSQ